MQPSALAEPGLASLLGASFARFAGQTAVRGPAGELTYAALERQVAALAGRLRAHGVAPGARFAVMTGERVETIVALLASLRAGCVFVPMDPAWPDERLRELLHILRPDALLADDAAALARVDGAARVAMLAGGPGDEALGRGESEVAPDAPCYIYFTSGSTGVPKGVMGRFDSLAHFVRWEIEALGLEAGFRQSQFVVPTFDAFLRDILVPLSVGGTLLIPPDSPWTMAPRALARWITDEGVEGIHCVPSLFRVLAAAATPGDCRALRHVIMAGEVLDVSDVERWRSVVGPTRLINLYGATETTMAKVVHEVTDEDVRRGFVAVGKAMPGARAMVVDERGRPCPDGIAGEIVIRSRWHTLGYFNDPALTAERFVRNPSATDPHDVVYRTRDLGRVLNDGSLQYLGRRDEQVKIGGVRVEPGEVESALRAHPGVADAAVVADGTGGAPRLVAYLVPGDAPPRRAELRRFLQQRLPAALVPALFVELAALPRRSNGKVKKEALPPPGAAQPEPETEYVAPRTPDEEAAAAVWAELLGRERVGVEDDFFELGGTSLLALRAVARLGDRFGADLSLRTLFEAPTVESFVRRAAAARRVDAGAALVPVSHEGDLPVSFAQERLWLFEQVEPGSAVYNIPAVFRLARPVDAARLERVLATIVRRHEALRTRFHTVDGVPVQRVSPDAEFRLAVADLAHLPAAERRAEGERLAQVETQRPFDLGGDLLLRALLVRLDEDDHLLALTLHHIAGDAWSLGVLLREMAVLSAGGELPPLPVQYTDYAVWQRQRAGGEAMARQLDYWRDRLAGIAEEMEVPTDRPAALARTHDGALRRFALAPELVERLRALARAEGCTLFMVMLAGWKALLARISGQDDVVVGSPTAGRSRPEVEELIGFFVNTVVLRTDVGGDPAFRELLARVRDTTLGAYEHQDLPFERVVEELAPERRLGRHPLAQVIFALHEASLFDVAVGTAALEPLESDRTRAKFDLTLMAQEMDGRVLGRLEYRTELFDAATIERMLEQYVRVLEQASADPERRVSEIDLLAADERVRVVADWNRTASEYPRNRCIHELVREAAARTPHAPALESDDGVVTYAELEARSDLLAERLRLHGVGLESCVGVLLERGPEWVVALLAILKAGGAYVPLDPDYPEERLAFMLRDSGAALLLTRSALADRVAAACPVVRLDDPAIGTAATAASAPGGESAGSRASAPGGEPPGWNDGKPAEAGSYAEAPVREGGLRAPAAVSTAGDGRRDGRPTGTTGPDSLAYVIYTSGSTGTPKGVAVPHRAIVRLVRGNDYAPLGDGDRVAQLSNASFDAATWELWGALTSGASLVFVPRDTLLDPEAFAEFVRERGLTALFITTALFNQIAHQVPDAFAPLRHLMFGGEQVDPAAAHRVLRSGAPGRLMNVYGPTENTTFSTFHVVEAVEEDAHTVPIGRPIAQSTAYVLDRGLRPVPAGVWGELFVGGDGVARGYLGRPTLTAERFVPDAFSREPGARLYRTGDRVRWRLDGTLEFGGRFDRQIKIRGFRIEPGEIETALLAHAMVAEAAVVVREEAPGQKRLVAYVAAPGASGEMLREHLRERLPAYMVPAALMVLDRLPLTPNGKVDRARLPAPEYPADDRAAPRTAAEATLAGIWAEVLGHERVGVEDNFFEIGGDSILAIQVVARAARAGLSLSARQLFEHQTVAALAAAARPAGATAAPDDAAEGDWAPLLPVQRWFFDQRLARPGHYNQSFALEVPGGHGPEHWRALLAALVRAHPGLRLRFARDEAGEWRQRIDPSDTLAWDEAGLEDLEDDDAARARLREHAARVQASLDPEAGPLFGAVLGRRGASDWLILIAHHLGMDGVSWRVLVEDLARAHAGHAPDAEPWPLARWARALGRIDAAHPVVEAAAKYWNPLRTHASAPLPRDGAGGDDVEGAAERVHAQLDARETRVLLHELPAAARARVPEVLASALARVLRRWSGGEGVWVEMEGHGRAEELVPGADLSRTVGWFTTLYPVWLAAPDDAAGALRAAKEQLRAVPDRGIGYGLLRATERGGEWPRPAVIFNYLGQFDTAVSGGPFSLAAVDAGPSRAAENRRSHELEVSARVVGGQLRVVWTFGPALHHRDTVERLAAEYIQAVREVLAEGESTRTLAPSDFPAAGLDEEQVARLAGTLATLEDLHPLSPLQEGMLLHGMGSGESQAYLVQLRYRIDGPLDADALRRAWEAVAAHHAILRGSVLLRGVPQPLLAIHRRVPLAWAREDWSGLASAQRDARMAAYLAADRARGIPADDAPLMRLALFQTDDGHELVWSYHHLLLDGWAHARVLADVRQAYAAVVRGGAAALAPARPYREYVDWLARQEREPAERFWRAALEGMNGPTPLRFPAPREPREGYAELMRVLDASATEALEAGARAQRVTAATLLQGAWALLLARATGVDDVVFGSVESGRPPELPGAETMVGPFINTLATRVRTGGDLTVRAWLQALQAEQAEARRFAYVPLPSVQRWAGLAGGTPLFESLIAFENYPIARGTADGGADLALRSVGAVERTGYPISLTASPARGGRAGWRVRLTYATDRFAPDAMERLAAGLERLLGQLATNPDARLADVQLLSPEERQQVLFDWNRTAADFPRGRCVHERFAEQARLTPHALAIDGPAGAITYAELDARADRLAQGLRQRGVGVETRVGVLLERGPELVVALLAILKAGGAYVPLDPEYPAERLAFMLRDSGAALLIGDAGRIPDPPCAMMRVDDAAVESAASAPGASAAGASTPASAPGVPAPAASAPGGEPPGWNHGKPAEAGSYADEAVREGGLRVVVAANSFARNTQNLAYVVYTSGSTGTPKGVMVSHEALGNLCDWHAHAFDVGSDARATLLASVGFDASAWELWPYLLRGASVRAVPAALRLAPAELGRWMETERVTHTFLPTPLAEALLAESTAGPSAWLLTGGDRMRRAPGAGLRFRVANNYGPTESTVVATSVEVAANEAGDPPIGRPTANTRTYVLDAALRPASIGAWGELYLGGAQLARGYLARPALTAERFIPDPFSDAGERLYRTGDRVRWTAEGVLEYGGRVDEQVKVRGHRIEPGEIEAALLAHPVVSEAAVVAREDAPGQTRLVAYVVTQATIDTLREHLRERVPAYMVPAAFVVLDQFPLTPNGKVDRRALPAPAFVGSATHIAPRDETEQRIARVWAEVLGMERVGAEDNFFDLGGDSLLLMRVYTRLGDTPGLTTVDLFRHPTVRSLAEHLAGGGAADIGARRDAIREGKNRVQQLLAQKKRR